MIRINLLGAEVEEQVKGGFLRLPEMGANATQIGIGAMLVGVLVVLGAAWWYQTGRLEEVRAELSMIELERSRLEEVARQVEELQSRTDVMREKLGVIAELKASQTGPVMLLDEVSHNLTDGLWLTRLDLNEGDVELRGSALSEVPVADFVNNLERSRYFPQVRLRTLGDSGESFDFQITLKFDPTPGGGDTSAPADGGTD